jgi:hypothetical protein
MTDQAERGRILDKLKKAYAKQKSAELIGSEAEALAFAAKIKELLSIHKIELSEIQQREQDEVDPMSRRLVDFHSAGITVRRCRVGWQETLADLACRAYFCTFAVTRGSSHLWFYGRGSDLDAAEQVFLYLVRVADNLADREYVRFFHECRRAGDVEAARGFRTSYLEGFTHRLAERYREEEERARRTYASTNLAMVRLTDALETTRTYMKNFTTKASGLGGRGLRNDEGWRRGRRDAENLPIGQNQRQVER